MAAYWERYKHDFLRLLLTLGLFSASFWATTVIQYAVNGQFDYALTAAPRYLFVHIPFSIILVGLLSFPLAAITAVIPLNRVRLPLRWICIACVAAGAFLGSADFDPSHLPEGF